MIYCSKGSSNSFIRKGNGDREGEQRTLGALEVERGFKRAGLSLTGTGGPHGWHGPSVALTGASVEKMLKCPSENQQQPRLYLETSNTSRGSSASISPTPYLSAHSPEPLSPGRFATVPLKLKLTVPSE